MPGGPTPSPVPTPALPVPIRFGFAILVTTTLTTGPHALTATFVPDRSTLQPSTSSPVMVTVLPPLSRRGGSHR